MDGSSSHRSFNMMPQQSARNRRQSFESERQRRSSTTTKDSQKIWESSNDNSNSSRSGGDGGGVAGAIFSMSTSFANALEAPLRCVDINQGNNGGSTTPKRRFSSLNTGRSFAPQSIPQYQQQCWTASDRAELVDRTPKLKNMLNEAIKTSSVVTAAAYKAVHHQFLYSDAVEREVQLANERRSNNSYRQKPNKPNILNLKPPTRLGNLLRSRSSIGIESNNTATASQSQLIGGSCRSLMVSASTRLSVGSVGGTVSTSPSSSSRRCSWNPVTSGDNSDSRRRSWHPPGGGGGRGDSRRRSWHARGGGAGSSDSIGFPWNPPGGGTSIHSRRGSWNPLSKSNTNGDRDDINSNIAPIKSSTVMVLSREDQRRILSHEEEAPASDCRQQDFGRKSLLMKSLVGIEDWSQSGLEEDDDDDDDDSFNKFLQRQDSDASLGLQDIFDGTEGAPILESSPPPVVVVDGENDDEPQSKQRQDSDASLNLQDIFDGTEGAPILESSPPPVPPDVVDDDGDDDEPQSELKASHASADVLTATCCTTLSRMGTLSSDFDEANHPDPDTSRIVFDLSNSEENDVDQVLKSSVQSSEHSYADECGWLPWPNTDPNEDDDDDDGSICNNGQDLLEPFHVPRRRHNSFSTPSRPKRRGGDDGTIGNVGDDLLVSFHLSYQGEDSSRPKRREGNNGTIGNVGDDLLVSFHLSYQGEDSFVSWEEERRIGRACAA